MAIKTANNQSMTAITALPSGVSAKSMILLATETASSSATISFTSNIDDTYSEYIFKFYDIHPATDNVNFTVNFRDGGSSYDATKTTTSLECYHSEDGSGSGLAYIDRDLANGTGVQQLNTANGIGNDNDQSLSGYLHLFNPSSTTFVKHFMAEVQFTQYAEATANDRVAGYCNVTAAIDGVQFAMSSGNIDAGVIKMYGVA